VHRCIGTTRRRRTAASNARSNGREESSRPFVFRAPRPLFAGLECQNEPRAEICTRTSVQVAIGLFPIDSVRAEFLLLSLLFFAHCLHLPFTCTSRSFFSRSPPPPLSLAPIEILTFLLFSAVSFSLARLFAISARTRLRKPCINDRIGGAFGNPDPGADH